METHDLTLAEAAQAVGLHVETLRRLARAGQIETYVVNPGSRRPHFRVTPAALQAFRTRGKRAARSEESASPSLGTLPDNPGPPFVEGIVPGTMSGAEMIAYWEREGVFEAFAERAAEIGPGRRFADSTQYVQYLREQSAGRPDK